MISSIYLSSDNVLTEYYQSPETGDNERVEYPPDWEQGQYM